MLLAAVGASGVLWMDVDSVNVSNAAPAETTVGAKTPAKAAPAAKKEETAKEKETAKTPEPDLTNVVTVQPDDLVNKPSEYLNKNVKFVANFFAFSNLALDYKPAMKSSKTHLSLLIVKPGSHIPLSELKLAMAIPKDKDPETELLAKLKDGDQIEIIGKEFSTALDDPWVEVFKLKRLSAAKEDKKETASSTTTTDDKDKTDKTKETPKETDKK